MNYRHLTCLLLTSPLLLHAAELPPQEEPPPCISTHDLNRVSLRHIESKGLGYNDGYTTLEGFFVPLSALNTRWVPFLDVRGHIFNNSKPAANAGIGLRYIESRVWGGNIYYDYRKTRERNYNQVSFGVESLGRYLDYRLNGYFPVGKHKGSLSDATFDHFSGHSLYLARKQELALKGTNAEVGVHIAKVKGIDFYSALGPYYFANDTKHTFGGEFRIGMDVRSILRIEGNTSYDHLFGWIGQGQISLSYAFTPKKMSRKEKKGSCSFHGFVRDRAFQRVDKQEIIVVTTQKKKSVAINPATGLPYVFWFVDNTSHSQGTYESPFNTLVDAANNSDVNDIIAVFPGDGTDKGMNAGIQLQNGQKLWGMSVLHALPTTLGTIKIKPLASVMPTVSKSSGYVITGANSNDIVGLKIIHTGSSGAGISIRQKKGYYNIENNIIFGGGTIDGISCNTVVANTIITNNTFIAYPSATNAWAVNIASSSGNFTISNNLFTGIDMNAEWTHGIVFENTRSITASIVGNTINFSPNANNAKSGFWVLASQGTTVLIADNTIKNFHDTSVSVGGMSLKCTPDSSITLRHNNVTTLDPVNAPAYLFGGSLTVNSPQINFAPDNIGGPPLYQNFSIEDEESHNTEIALPQPQASTKKIPSAPNINVIYRPVKPISP